MQELVAINIVIGDRNYRIKIEPKDEETVRNAVKVIQDKVTEFKTQFSGKDMQDYIAMVMLWYATQANGEVTNIIQQQELQEELEKIARLLDKATSIE